MQRDVYKRQYQQGVITVFMLLFGVNFNVYYLMLIRKPKEMCIRDRARSTW